MSKGLLGDYAVLFTGRSGAGKTAAATYVANRVPRANIYSMAEEIKRIARGVGWDGVKDPAGRALLQDWGTVGRNYDPDMWVNAAIKTWRDDKDRGFWHTVFVSDDVRYPNEIGRISEVFSSTSVIRITRLVGAELAGEAAKHMSEQWEMLPYDYEIANDGDILALYHKLSVVIGKIGLRQVARNLERIPLGYENRG